MRGICAFALVVAILACQPAMARIVDATATANPADDFTLTTLWDGVDNLTLNEKVSGSHAGVTADIVADPPMGDPLVWVRKNVENDTGYAWGAYDVAFTMPVDFSFVTVEPQTGWTYSTTAVTPISGGKWTGTVHFAVDTGGLAIADSDYGEFDVRVSIPSSVKFCVDQTPYAPEPASLALLALGGLFFRRTKK